ncbi:hypothetical protein ACFLT9_12855 [Acidobacteriota bacterium]
MKKILALVVLALVLSGGTILQADEVIELKEKIIEIRNKGELGFSDFTVCSQIMGFASYAAIPNNVVDINGTLLVYYEPENIFTSMKDGIYEIWYTQDMSLLDESGELIKEWLDILNFHYMTKKPFIDMFAQNSLEIKGQLPAGKYKFQAVLKDKLRNKSVTKVIDFVVK